MNILVNVVLFQLGWFACVLGAAYGAPFLGTAIGVGIATRHVLRAVRPGKELGLVMIAAAVGIVWDSALVMSGYIAYPNGILVAGFAPVWIVALWGLFATTLNVALRWLHGRMVLCALFGAVGGPLAYYGGAKLGALQLLDLPLALGAQALGWALLMPLLVFLARRFDGVKQPVNGAQPCLT